MSRWRSALGAGTFVRGMLSGPRTSKVEAGRVSARLIALQGTPHLSLTWHHDRKDETRNMTLEEGCTWIGEALHHEYRNGLLCTTQRDWQFIHPQGRKPRLASHAPGQTSTPAREHDTPKATSLGTEAQDWLEALGILTPAGQLRASMADKLRQVERYSEILGHLAAEANLPADQPVRIADMGSGKGYLTFAAWHLFRRKQGLDAQVTGVEARPELVEGCNQAASRLKAEGLGFRTGTIEGSPTGPLEILIALHACNRATDEALLKGIDAGARLILLAPCCHQDLRPRITSAGPLEPLLRHGLLKERFAEWLTDGLRTLHLEWAGYRTKVIEFVASEHTARNVMIAAVRARAPYRDAGARQAIESLQAQFGIQGHPLARLLERESNEHESNTSSPVRRS